MIHIIFGKDTFRVRAALRAIRDDLESADDMLETNTTTLDGGALTAGELLAHVSAVPFLGSARLVVVEGLLKHLGEQRRGRRGKKADAQDPLEEWRGFARQLGETGAMPSSTTLVFVEGELSIDRNGLPSSAAFALFAPLARVKAFAPLQSGELAGWIREAAATKGANLGPRAVAALAQLIGPDLWALDNELDKLAAYADGELVEYETVGEVVSAAQQSRIWDLTDAIVEGNDMKAAAALQRLLRDGEPPTLIAFMIVRQFRQITLVKDMRSRRVRQEEVERATGIKNFRLRAVMDLANRYSWGDIRRAYALLLASDLAVKRGIQNDEASLDLLVHELCELSPRGRQPSGRPTADGTSIVPRAPKTRR